MRWLAAILLMLIAAPAAAHDVSGAINSLLAWSYDPWLLTPLYLIGICFYVGTQRVWHAAGFRHGVQVAQVAAFWTGWLVLALAITSPLHWLGERLFSGHMIEHGLMMVVAAPLMAYARINGALLWSLPRRWRPVAGRLVTTGLIAACWRAVSHPVTATALHGLALWLWHAPPLYRQVLENGAVHRLQHISFFLTALLFWWVLFYGRGAGRSAHIRDGVSVACLFVTVLHSGLLGALLTLSPRLWFPQQGLLAAEFGLTPLEDQQLAGLLMWIPMGTLYTCAGLFFAYRWLSLSGSAVRAVSLPEQEHCSADFVQRGPREKPSLELDPMHKVVILSALLAVLAASPIAAQGPNSPSCPVGHNRLADVLKKSVKPSGGPSNGGIDNNEWAAVVNREGLVCAVAFSGNKTDDQWPGSRAIAAEKANTANAFSLPNKAIATANLYAQAQPGGYLFGAVLSSPPNPTALYAGQPSEYGSAQDPLVGKTLGGIIVFGGGLALYDGNGVAGALGVSGDSACADHNVAWRVRHFLGLDKVPAGVSPNMKDAIIYDIGPDGKSTSGFGHPKCDGREDQIAVDLGAGVSSSAVR